MTKTKVAPFYLGHGVVLIANVRVRSLQFLYRRTMTVDVLHM